MADLTGLYKYKAPIYTNLFIIYHQPVLMRENISTTNNTERQTLLSIINDKFVLSHNITISEEKRLPW